MNRSSMESSSSSLPRGGCPYRAHRHALVAAYPAAARPSVPAATWTIRPMDEFPSTSFAVRLTSMMSTPITEWQVAREGCGRNSRREWLWSRRPGQRNSVFRSCLVCTGHRREADCRAASTTSCALASLEQERMRFPCRPLHPGSPCFPSAARLRPRPDADFYLAPRENFATVPYSVNTFGGKAVSGQIAVVAIRLRIGGHHELNSTRSLSNRFLG